MIRVVLDTNVIVSAALTRGGSEAYVLDLALANKFRLCLTKEILAEYEDVLRRAKFRRLGVEAIENLIALVRRNAMLVEPGTVLTVSPDESDNRFLECAQAAKAQYLVTGNSRHFPKQWKKTSVINARQLIELLIE